jgi:hypothetical protein
MVQGIALLDGLFVDPSCGNVASAGHSSRPRARKNREGAAEGFYKRLGTVKIGEGLFYFSPDVVLPHFLYIVPQLE